jgi:hypothetical protein
MAPCGVYAQLLRVAVFSILHESAIFGFDETVTAFFFPAQRANAAFCAISFRRAGESFLFRIAFIACATAFFFGVFITAIVASRKHACCFRFVMLTKALTICLREHYTV